MQIQLIIPFVYIKEGFLNINKYIFRVNSLLNTSIARWNILLYHHFLALLESIGKGQKLNTGMIKIDSHSWMPYESHQGWSSYGRTGDFGKQWGFRHELAMEGIQVLGIFLNVPIQRFIVVLNTITGKRQEPSMNSTHS